MNNLEIVLVFLLKTEILGKNNELKLQKLCYLQGRRKFFSLVARAYA